MQKESSNALAGRCTMQVGRWFPPERDHLRPAEERGLAALALLVALSLPGDDLRIDLNHIIAVSARLQPFYSGSIASARCEMRDAAEVLTSAATRWRTA